MIDIFEYGKDNTDKVFTRSQLTNVSVRESVSEIIKNVRENGDESLFEYALKFDGIDVQKSGIAVSDREIKDAYKAVSPELLSSLRRSIENVLDYHKRQIDRFSSEIYDVKSSSKLGWMYRAMDKAGLYIPGGKASYPSSILMCSLPAKAAGVKEISLATPNPKNPLTLVAAAECGIDKIYKVGGAHAIAALAFGTKSVGKVDIIAGPGNVYVTEAKKQVYGFVGIDMIAGPSEILVIADDSANARFVAADMLSQAEHDELAASILVTPSRKLAEETAIEIERQRKTMSRKGIIDASLKNNGAIIIAEDMSECIEIADRIAPEHLELCVENAAEVAKGIRNAGAVFVGNYSPEPLGDYFAGPSHCLPTSGSARYFSVLSVDTFMKKISYIEYSKEDLFEGALDITAIAECEGLTAHANTIYEMLNYEKG